jgi:hypothetical protein
MHYVHEAVGRRKQEGRSNSNTSMAIVGDMGTAFLLSCGAIRSTSIVSRCAPVLTTHNKLSTTEDSTQPPLPDPERLTMPIRQPSPEEHAPSTARRQPDTH